MTATHGLYLYRSSTPLYTGTHHECRQSILKLTAAERLHGWVIAPLPSRYWPENWAQSPVILPVSRVWALVGLGILALAAGLGLMAVKGHLHL